MSHSVQPINLPALAPSPWQMYYGERLAFEGILSQAAPRLAVEIGTAEGGSLRRIAAHSHEVHSFDLVAPLPEVAALDNVSFHTGDSHALVPEFLAEAGKQGRSIDFVLIDGDHTAGGVRDDIVDVLDADAVSRAVIVLHDTFNPEVRRGIKAARIAEHPKVALFEPDLVPGYLPKREPDRLQMWGGLGLIVVDAERRARAEGPIRHDRFHELFAIVRPTVEVMRRIEREHAPLDGLPAADIEAALRTELTESVAERDRLAARLRSIEGSRGWRLVQLQRELRQILRRR